MGLADPVLERFYEGLPTKPYCSDDLEAGLIVRGRNQAPAFRYIQLNGIIRRYLVADIDRPGAAFAHEDARLPGPTIRTISPESGRGHLLWELRNAVLFPDTYGRLKTYKRQMKYFELIQDGICAQIGGDPCYNRTITKTPGHEQWHTLTFNRAYDLDEFFECLDLSLVRRVRAARATAHNSGFDPESIKVIPKGFRNDTIFNALRFYAYAQVKTCASFEELFNLDMLRGADLNTKCDPPLPERNIFGIVKSVTKWTWNRKETIGKGAKNRGVLGLEPMPPVMEASARARELEIRQRKGAAYTNAMRRFGTREALIAARKQLEENGKKVTVAAMARIADVSRVIIYRDYPDLLP